MIAGHPTSDQDRGSRRGRKRPPDREARFSGCSAIRRADRRPACCISRRSAAGLRQARWRRRARAPASPRCVDLRTGAAGSRDRLRAARGRAPARRRPRRSGAAAPSRAARSAAPADARPARGRPVTADGAADGEAALLGVRDRRRPASRSSGCCRRATSETVDGAARDGAHRGRRGRDRAAVQRRGRARARARTAEVVTARFNLANYKDYLQTRVMGATPRCWISSSEARVERDVRLQAAQGAFAPARPRTARHPRAACSRIRISEIRETADDTLNQIPVEALEKFLARSDVADRPAGVLRRPRHLSRGDSAD